MTATQQTPSHCEGMQPIPPPDDWLEKEVIAGFRVWQVMFLILAGIICVVVLMCCFMKCRIPRTKQEIEADFARRKLTQDFRSYLNKLPPEGLDLKTAVESVRQMCENDEKPDEEEEQGCKGLIKKIKLLILGQPKSHAGDKEEGEIVDEEAEAEDEDGKEADDNDEDSAGSSHHKTPAGSSEKSTSDEERKNGRDRKSRER